MLRDLATLKEQAKQLVATKFNSNYSLTDSLKQEILSLYTRLYPNKPASIVDSTLRVDNSADLQKAQTSYLPIQWFLRISCCEELIKALKEYSVVVEQMKKHVHNDVMRKLPMIDWKNKLETAEIAEIQSFINTKLDNSGDRERFSELLDGRCWLDTKKGGIELAGRSLERRPDAYIGSAIAGVVRFINENAGSLPDFINLYLESDALRAELSVLGFSSEHSSPKNRVGENIIFYGAPGTGKSHRIDNECSDDTSIRTVFHPETQYSDFVGCLKPSMNGVNVVYAFRPGPFCLALKLAYDRKEEHTYLVIEEINRAAAAAAFGELFQLLDRRPTGESSYSITVSDPDMLSYLQKEAPSALTGNRLKIPENLSIYATMNSSDQAVMPMDTAFKRRWKFEYMPISFDGKNGGPKGFIPIVFSNGETHKINWSLLAKTINDALSSKDIPEDRLLGPWFLSEQELADETAAMATLKGKLFLYIWDDVLRHNNTTVVFSSHIKTFGDLIAKVSSNQAVFDKQIEANLLKDIGLKQVIETTYLEEETSDNEFRRVGEKELPQSSEY